MQHVIRNIALASWLLAGGVQADEQSGSFLGVMGGQMEYSEDGIEDLEFVALTARVGHDFNRWVGIEVRGGTTVNDDEIMGIEVDIPYFISALARVGWLPVDGNGIGVYGLAGYTTGKLEAEFMGFGVDETANSPSFGAGAEWMINERNGLNVEYIRYLDEEIAGSDVEVSHIGIGYIYRF